MSLPTIEDIAAQRPDKRWTVQITMESSMRYFHSTNLSRNWEKIWEKPTLNIPGKPRIILPTEKIESIMIMENENVQADTEGEVPPQTTEITKPSAGEDASGSKSEC